MTKLKYWALFVFVMVVLPIPFMSCSNGLKKPVPKMNEDAIPSVTILNDRTAAITFLHDHHKFLLVNKYQAVSFIHHPDCACKGGKE